MIEDRGVVCGCEERCNRGMYLVFEQCGKRVLFTSPRSVRRRTRQPPTYTSTSTSSSRRRTPNPLSEKRIFVIVLVSLAFFDARTPHIETGTRTFRTAQTRTQTRALGRRGRRRGSGERSSRFLGWSFEGIGGRGGSFGRGLGRGAGVDFLAEKVPGAAGAAFGQTCYRGEFSYVELGAVCGQFLSLLFFCCSGGRIGGCVWK